MTRILEANRKENFDVAIMRELGEQGFLGSTIPEEYGGAGVGHVAYGLIAREVERVDSGYRSAMSVQSSLVMHPINAYGTEEQKQKYLPKLASGEMIGCFGLTEPDHGSDPGSMVTRAEKVDGGYRLTGAKMWITNSPIADIAIVWAKSDAHEGKIKGFIVEAGTEGYSAPKIEGKMSLKASITGEIVLDNAFVPDDNLLPNVQGLAGPVRLPQQGPFWHRMGRDRRGRILLACRTTIYPRPQAVWPPAGPRPSSSSGNWPKCRPKSTLGLQAALRVGRMMDEGNCPVENVSLIKRNNCGKALNIARLSRDMHGGNGIADEFHVIRHMVNLETVNTYEGTHDIHALILGRAQTGLQAFF